ncbi:hypothetical protein SPFL3102_03170 [Sporomusaceae bacterium FL31]|nr:hypothetical protein SPFL3101_00874 [Sporomusaceae bacterium FL31]GCE35334.1 hypothetical protein SPFL3102_03170 [Sporomusaceae bacterium]
MIKRSIMVCLIALISLMYSPSVFAANWQEVYTKQGFGTYFIDIDSIDQKKVVVSATAKYELTPFGAGFFTAIMQGIQKNQEFARDVDFSRVKSMQHKLHIDIRNYQFASDGEVLYDFQGNKIYQWPQHTLQWKVIQEFSDDDQAAKFVISILAERLYESYEQ